MARIKNTFQKIFQQRSPARILSWWIKHSLVIVGLLSLAGLIFLIFAWYTYMYAPQAQLSVAEEEIQNRLQQSALDQGAFERVVEIYTKRERVFSGSGVRVDDPFFPSDAVVDGEVQE